MISRRVWLHPPSENIGVASNSFDYTPQKMKVCKKSEMAIGAILEKKRNINTGVVTAKRQS